ncbi:hypothetical protein [Klebsiella pneumoniae]|uniref:hypothetical protein n=1 Tax=Klebsiella pneumoniae TaxID=573 RepID=UPI0039873606
MTQKTIVHIEAEAQRKGDRPDAGPRQRFRRPGADPADPDHADVGVGKTLQRNNVFHHIIGEISHVPYRQNAKLGVDQRR